MSIDQLLLLSVQAGTAAAPLLVLFIYALYKEWIVLGKDFREIVKERDEWRYIALRGSNIAEKAFLQTRRRLKLVEDTDEDTKNN